jgi:hypothetical protein
MNIQRSNPRSGQVDGFDLDSQPHTDGHGPYAMTFRGASDVKNDLKGGPIGT